MIIPTTLTKSCHAGHHCGSQGSQLGKHIDDFSLSASCLVPIDEPASRVEAS